MNIHEYQAKNILSNFGVFVPRGEVVFSTEQARSVANSIQSDQWVVKSQIHAGGRGKAGGVKIASSIEEVESLVKSMMGSVLVTPQTGVKGQEVKKVYIEEGIDIDQEFYLAVTLDRSKAQYIVMASSEGGMEIEEVAKKNPQKIFKTYINPLIGMQPYQARYLANKLNLKGSKYINATNFILCLAKAAQETDASLIEINPLVVTRQEDVIALDAKMNFDDNALYRQKKINSLRDSDEEDTMEMEANNHGLNYIRLNGNIGCMVNGAGLAMATMDIIKLEGGEPANFLDVGGGATEEKVKKAFNIILSDKKVRSVLVNIFGGIMRCDTIARGVIAAAKEASINVPLVVRLEGTNVEKGLEILSKSGLNIISADNLSDAAKKAVSNLKG